jgi:YD repeat-containing protein
MSSNRQAGLAWLASAAAFSAMAAASPALAQTTCPGLTPVGPTGATVPNPGGMPGNCTSAFSGGMVSLSGHLIANSTDTFTGTQYTYDQQGHLVDETYSDGLSVTFGETGGPGLNQVDDPLGHVTTLTYDAGHSLTSVTDPSSHVTTYTYDAGEHVTSTDVLGHLSTYTYDPDDRMETSTDPDGKTTTYTYDPGGPLGQSSNSGGMTTYTYDPGDGLLSQVTDPLGHTTSYTYDADDRVIAETISGPTADVVTYTYDAFGNLIEETDSLLGITTFTYDAQGNLIEETDPAGQSILESWNDGLLQSLTDPSGNTITYTYDAQHQLIGEIDPGGLTVSYAYVPEPQAWALMLAGFAGVGFALRRRAARRSLGLARA